MIFVTSFDESLYNASARKMIQTFIDVQRVGALICCVEWLSRRSELEIEASAGNAIIRHIDRDPRLAEWDQKFRAECEAEGSYWNRRAWQWYRKIFSLGIVLGESWGWEGWLFWVDCDCHFRKNLSPADLDVLAEGAAVIYLKGQRDCSECGLVAFNLSAKAGDARGFITEIGRCYDSGDFRKFTRWDDSWIFDQVRKDFPSEMFKDVANPQETTRRVVDSSKIGEFIFHNKGSHTRSGVRVKSGSF